MYFHSTFCSLSLSFLFDFRIIIIKFRLVFAFWIFAFLLLLSCVSVYLNFCQYRNVPINSNVHYDKRLIWNGIVQSFHATWQSMEKRRKNHTTFFDVHFHWNKFTCVFFAPFSKHSIWNVEYVYFEKKDDSMEIQLHYIEIGLVLNF